MSSCAEFEITGPHLDADVVVVARRAVEDRADPLRRRDEVAPVSERELHPHAAEDGLAHLVDVVHHEHARKRAPRAREVLHAYARAWACMCGARTHVHRSRVCRVCARKRRVCARASVEYARVSRARRVWSIACVEYRAHTCARGGMPGYTSSLSVARRTSQPVCFKLRGFGGGLARMGFLYTVTSTMSSRICACAEV